MKTPTKPLKKPTGRKLVLGVLLGALFAILVFGVLQMPRAGNRNNPAYGEITQRYLRRAEQDTNAPNVVNSVITDFRALDTLGEAAVLFTATAAVSTVLSALRIRKR